MNLNNVQSSSCVYQTHINQGMTKTQDSTEYIDLQAIGGRQPLLSQSLESYPEQKGIIYPNFVNNFVEKSNQGAMICLTEFRTHANDSNEMKQDLPRKRLRTTFSASQLKRLESEFHCNMYVVGLKRLRLAQELKLEERHIKIWFQNRRMKFKRDQRLHERNANMAFQNYCFY